MYIAVLSSAPPVVFQRVSCSVIAPSSINVTIMINFEEIKGHVFIAEETPLQGALRSFDRVPTERFALGTGTFVAETSSDEDDDDEDYTREEDDVADELLAEHLTKENMYNSFTLKRLRCLAVNTLLDLQAVSSAELLNQG